ncbi:MAG: peptidylprolyl isomerase [Armatimonadota bacterium]
MVRQWQAMLIVSFSALMLAGAALGSSPSGDGLPADTWVARVDGEPLSARLFERRLIRNRSDAYRYFRQKYGVADSAGFWTTPHDGDTPLDWLRTRTLAECVRMLVEQKLALGHGVVADTSYSAFLSALARENERRRRAVAAHQPVYGPEQYDEDEYFDYCLANTVIELKRRLGAGELAASDDVLRQRYEESKAALYDRGDRVVVLAVRVPFSSSSGGSSAPADAKQLASEVRDKLAADATAESIESACGYRASVEELVFDDATARADGTVRPLARGEAMELAPGQVSPVFHERGSSWVMKCLSRQPLGYRPLDEVKDNVRSRYVDERYEALVADLVSRASVEINREVYDAVKVR